MILKSVHGWYLKHRLESVDQIVFFQFIWVMIQQITLLGSEFLLNSDYLVYNLQVYLAGLVWNLVRDNKLAHINILTPGYLLSPAPTSRLNTKSYFVQHIGAN